MFLQCRGAIFNQYKPEVPIKQFFIEKSSPKIFIKAAELSPKKFKIRKTSHKI